MNSFRENDVYLSTFHLVLVAETTLERNEVLQEIINKILNYFSLKENTQKYKNPEHEGKNKMKTYFFLLEIIIIKQ